MFSLASVSASVRAVGMCRSGSVLALVWFRFRFVSVAKFVIRMKLIKC